MVECLMRDEEGDTEERSMASYIPTYLPACLPGLHAWPPG